MVWLGCTLGFLLGHSALGTDRFVSPAGGNSPPFTTWAAAATNIQDAIDAAGSGDLIWVTNGVYATGGRAVASDLTNRVTLDKPLTVQSVNGAWLTIIQGAWDPSTTNGPLAVRCAWLTNGATLSGFTLRGGATREVAYPSPQAGGGVTGRSNGVVANCLVVSNMAASYGGGASGLILTNCTLLRNGVFGAPSQNTGGGADNCTLRNCLVCENFCAHNGGGISFCNAKNCAITKNSAILRGGGAYSSTLVNCTVEGNFIGFSTSPGSGGGASASKLTNSIIVGNFSVGSTSSNYEGSTLSYCCASPLPAGSGNISADPQFLGDGVHVGNASACIGAGTGIVSFGTDIDGQPWANPASIGCDEWLAAPVFAAQPKTSVAGIPVNLSIGRAVLAGQDPFAFFWTKDGGMLTDGLHYNGTQTSNLTVNAFGPADAGDYQLVASNGFAQATSAVIRVVVHCVNAASPAAVTPYSDWPTAASNIQDAIDASNIGDFILVTNGIYVVGGKAITGDLTNRAAVNKPLALTSVNGASSTIIQGAWDPAATNGPLAIRCVWLADEATLNGFTLQGGATRTNGDVIWLQSGGGVWAASTNTPVQNCLISNNAASYGGGGSFRGLLTACTVAANRGVQNGGGSLGSKLVNSLITGNWSLYGGGVAEGYIANCTVISNVASSSGYGGGTYSVAARNCIIYFNSAPFWPNYSVSGGYDFSYTCTTPSASGTSNIPADPQFLDGVHLAATSPCRGAGSVAFSSGTDFDGEPWANSPSMGCDEVWEAAINGPLGVAASTPWSGVAEGRTLPLIGQLQGRASRVGWWFGDGSFLTNAS